MESTQHNATDEKFMRRAIELAKKAWGDTSPNPMVGAVLVKNGKIISEGYHTRDGFPHAEIECLRASTESPEGATLYVTLEPCSTRGRTGACCDAIKEAKIAEVKIGTLDPNPAHAGRALPILQDANIKYQHGILGSECSELNFIFNFAITQNKPLVALKYAISADGKIAEKQGVQTRITGDQARADVMKWRRLFSAIAVGRGTLQADNPSLTSRGFKESEFSQTRIVFDSSLSISKNSDVKKFKLFSDNFSEKSIVVCDCNASIQSEKKLADMGIRIMRISAPVSQSEIFWDEVKSKLHDMRINSLYIEGGAGLIKSVCDAKAVDFAFEYKAPHSLGENALSAFENNIRPFEIEGKKIDLGKDTLTFGKVKWIQIQ